MEEQSQERRSEENRQEELFRMIEKKIRNKPIQNNTNEQGI